MAQGGGIAHVQNHSFSFSNSPPFSFLFSSSPMAMKFSFTFQFIVTFYFSSFSLLYLSYHSHYVMSAVQSSDLSCLISKRNNARCLIHPHIPILITITSNLKNNNNRCLNSHCQSLAQEPAATEASTIH